jgi:N utilization substance protein A
MVVSELRGEKIDIIPWNTEPARFVAKALSPARVREVYIDDASRDATVVVPDDQLALAIGKEGLNARLAARLTGWKVDIVSDTEFAQQEAEAAFGGEGDADFSGRCAALLANGKRCPNTSLPGSRFCGVPAHQELAKIEARTGEYAPGTVTPATAEAEESEDSDAAESENGTQSESSVTPGQPAAQTAVAEQSEESPVEPAPTQQYEEGRAPAA